MKLPSPKQLVLFVITFLFHLVLFSQNKINFKHIIPQINNRNIIINKTAQDQLGNIWMTCNDGVVKFNGYSYQLIKKKAIFPKIDDEDHINFIQTDVNKNIWLKSSGGLLSKYNYNKGKFETKYTNLNERISAFKIKENEVWFITKTGRLFKNASSKTELITTIPNINGAENKIENIEFGGHSQIFISTSKGKIYIYSIKTKILNELIGPYTNYPGSIILKADKYNKLWIGTETFGILIYDLSTETFIENHFFKPEDNINIKQSLFISLFLDSSGNIWGGTDGDGLYKINSKNGKLFQYKKNNSNKFSLSSNTILNIHEDNHKNIWIVTNYGIINIIPKHNKNVNYHKGSANNIPLRILSIYKSKQGILWFGTDGTGLTMVDEKNKVTKQFFNDATSGFYVQSIAEDHNENIWFGTYKNGLWIYYSNKKTFKRIPVLNSKNQKATDIRTVFKDSKQRIWVGSNVAINIYNSNLNLIASFNYTKKGLKGNILQSIVEDSNQTVWLGLQNGGLSKFNENHSNLNHSTFTSYKFNTDKISPGIKSMSIGNSNNIWFINDIGKLILFNTISKIFKPFDHFQPLKSNLRALLNENHNVLWLSSSNGIHRFNILENSITTFYSSDGFQNDYFMNRSIFKDKNRLLYFGSTQGVNFFNPKKLIKKKSSTKLFISNIEVLNKPAKSLLKNQISTDLSKLDKLSLKNNQSSFSVKFSAIGNILSPNYYYTYKLKGFDKDWKTVYTEGNATYTNVPPGQYTLNIKVSDINENSVISKKQLQIDILQPIWKTSAAYTLYTLIVCGMIYGFIKWYQLRKKLLVNKIMRRKENELHQAKMNFFTKMSHEIQTPITLILGPIEDMLKRAEVNGNLLLKERLTIISNNVIRLSKIARELTLVRNNELNKLKLSVTQNNIYENIDKISLSFKELARSKNIDFSINCPKNLNNTWYDKEKIEHILYNLLSNAFKFTPKEGNVQLSVTPLNKKSVIKITVSDSGTGIKKEDLNKIFKLFYRSKNNKDTRGTGIGLALSKELINLHKGKIKVSSTLGEGTIFTVKIPVSETNYTNTEKIISSTNKKNEIVKTNSKKLKPDAQFDKPNKSILIVEDNFELQNFIKSLFETRYNILLAENGQEGYYLAKNNIPDLILSDIMMPIMDGISMCKALGENKLTKHIPIILLTAKNSTKSKIEGLKTGAIEYISKPFNTNEIILKVNNILISKENIITKYRKELINKPEIKINKSPDEIFLENLVSVVNKRLVDSNFKVDELTKALNMSYSSLYRKSLALTGLNLIDFIRLLRLKKAAILLIKYKYSISEVAYMVGFNDPKYFSKSFKKQFKCTPKQFKTKALTHANVTTYLNQYNINIMDYNSISS